MEKTFLMKVVQIRLYCDECSVEMEKTSEGMGAYMTINYTYTCPKCGATHRTSTKYPYTDYIPTNTPVMTLKN